MVPGPDLEVTFYPCASHLAEDVLRPVCSEHGGIAQSLLFSAVNYADELAIKSIGVQMPAYHKVLLDPQLDMQYHLSGYGRFYEEALIRLAGEAIERYALMVAQHSLADKIRYATYEEVARDGPVLPFEYLCPFSDADYEKLNRGHYRGARPLGQGDVVGWVRCPSLFEPGSEIWVPAQMLFVGYKLSRERGEVAFCPGFSTGTAAHTSLTKALQNALLEAIEIDGLMLHWYTGRKAAAVTVDNLTVTGLLPRLFAATSRYEVVMLDLGALEGVDAYVLGAVLLNKTDERPLVILGAQGHLDPVRACYRGLMEALASAFLGIYGPLFLPRQFRAPLTGEIFTDLDRNVAFFASPENAAEKRAVLKNLIGDRRVLSAMKSHDTGDVRADTARLVRQLSSVSRHGVYLDVTPPETRSRGWNVMRVLVPELLTMCVPGVPYSRHPRFRMNGGIRNAYPHPLP